MPLEKEKVSAFRPIEEQEACVMLYNFLDDPAGMDRHVLRSVPRYQIVGLHSHKDASYSTAITMEIAYGHRILSNDDEYLKTAERILDILREASRPSLLDVSPICWSIKYAWAP